jgi:hypothetical protein
LFVRRAAGFGGKGKSIRRRDRMQAIRKKAGWLAGLTPKHKARPLRGRLVSGPKGRNGLDPGIGQPSEGVKS